VLLWLGERNTALRFGGTIPVHDACTLLSMILVAGHLYLALVDERTSPALSGMVGGSIDAAFAREHHAAWTPEPPAPWRASQRARLAALAVVVAGCAATLALVRDVLL
jgi:cytochrome b subunit of formate dehydrogenase